MTFIGVPWAVGGGAKNTVEGARLVAYVATRGASGVLLPEDCSVQESAVPDGFVQVHPGSVVIPNAAAGTSGESYLGKNIGLHPLPITPTGAGETRSDLVYVNVADPQYAGQPAPVDIEDGPYIEPRVCAGVLPSTTSVADAVSQGLLPAGTTGVALARIDLPASTGTVTQTLITDLRELANPRDHRILTAPAYPDNDDLTGSTFSRWPDVGLPVQVPDWATRVTVRADLGQMVHFAPNVTGYLRVKFGTATGPQMGYDLDADTGASRTNLFVFGEFSVAEALRGTTVTVSVEGMRTAGASGYLSTWTASTMLLAVEFHEEIETP